MAPSRQQRRNIMIYAVVTLAVMVLILYVCGCFLVRAFLKTADSTDKDKLYPVLC